LPDVRSPSHCEGGTVAAAASTTCSFTTAVWLLGDRIAVPLGEWPEASQAARKNRNLVCATLRLRTSLRAASLGSHGQAGRGPRAQRRRVIWFIQNVGRERRLIDYYETSGVPLHHYALAAVRVGNPFLAAPQPFAGTPSRRAVKRVGHLEPLGSEAASESPGVF
jgi:hypothetical protein